MKRVTGIGGIFFKAQEPQMLREWYETHLGIPNMSKYGGIFEWATDKEGEKGHTVWGPFANSSKYFEPSKKEYMFNYRVENLEKLLNVLEEEGVEIVGEIEEYEYGKFGWVLDPEGNKIELWEPNDKVFREVNSLK